MTLLEKSLTVEAFENVTEITDEDAQQIVGDFIRDAHVGTGWRHLGHHEPAAPGDLVFLKDPINIIDWHIVK